MENNRKKVKEIEGTVKEISRVATNQNRVAYFNAIISLKSEGDIKIGMTVETS